MPYNTLFPGQEPNEKVILFLRRHWFVFFKMILFYIILLILPWVVRKYIVQFVQTVITDPDALILLNLLYSLYYVYVVTFFYRAWLDYYLDVWIVTNQRVVNIEQKGLFNRIIAAHRLYRIQDVRADVKGLLPTFLHYGNVNIQTAGTAGHFVFQQVPNPYAVTKKIITLVDWKKRVMMAKGIKVN